ncbi:complex I intermediate-associated protein 30, mitochondrial [Belonocnema kinseyi]|uniref:complex I intermediate-associated protein 30, mitochondrial n=1 Tax=Belonocnema kinseyi TaxID=2817044 RepID=UPI00143DFAF6|nr:complex I intermediate-associated protein 30, mitochondrial [Belonocnema kinseyi]
MHYRLIFRALLSSTVKNARKSIHTTAGYKVPDVWQPNKKGGTYNREQDEKKSPEEEEWEEQSFGEKIKGEWSMIKKEFAKFKDEWKENLKGPVVIFRKGEVDVIWRFSEDKECLNNWIVSTDSDNNEGYSTAKLELSPHGSGIFSGNLDLRVPEDGEVHYAGYANLRSLNHTISFGRESTMDWSVYTHLRMKIRGDGRTYMINIGVKQTFDVQWFELYNFVLATRGGPYWQIIRIPLNKFFLTHKGRVQDRQRPLEKNKVNNIGFTCADKVPGPFRLEIEYIGIESDESCTEEFAYESYDVDTMKL